ncbi:MAG TPA: hypothetical protein VER76_13025, partial [Pyrinomonadaceae bacterium]|nr:hypothetical protein [Pyrinomonadaceae bacterium]
MKKYLLTMLLMLGMPFTSSGQEQSRKPKAEPTGQKARKQPLRGAKNDEPTTKVKLKQPKRVSTQAFIDL